MVVRDTGWVDYDFVHSTVCQGLSSFGRIGWVTRQDGATSQIKVNPTHVPDHHCNPVDTYEDGIGSD